MTDLATASAGPTFGTYDNEGIVRYGFLGANSEAAVFDGDMGATPQYFLGELDDVRIYDKALTPLEIAEVMRGDPLLAWGPQPPQGAVLDIERPITVSGSGVGLFEGNVVVRVQDAGGNVLAEQATTAQGEDVGVGGPGTEP